MKETYLFDLTDKRKPEKIIEDKMKELQGMTKGYVCGNVMRYDGTVTSYV